LSAIARNLVWLLVTQVATLATSLIILVAAPRVFGDAQFGELAFAFAYVGFFQLVGLLGTNTFLVKTVARDRSSLGGLVFNTLVMKVALGTALSVLAVALAYLLGYSSTVIVVIAAGCVGMSLNMLNDTLGAGLQGLELMARPAMWGVVQQYAATALGLLVLVTTKSLVTYSLVFALANLVPVLGNGVQLWPALKPNLRIELRVWKFVALGGLPFLLWTAVLLIYGSIDIPLLEAMAGEATVGWYAVAYKWVALPAVFSSIVVTAYFPQLSAQSITNADRFASMANHALRLVVFVGAPIAVGIALVAEPVLTLVYHGEFQNAVPLLQILALHLPLVGIDMVLGMALVANDRQKQWVIVGCVAAVFNILLNIPAILLSVHFLNNGAIGAASVTVATEMLMMVAAIRLRPAGIVDRATTSLLLRTIAACLPMIPVVLVLRDTPLALQIAAGALTFAVSSFLLRATTTTELRPGIQKLLGARRLRNNVHAVTTPE
jgi:PST family polysaccharide transporter